jgi:hypothetical protein
MDAVGTKVAEAEYVFRSYFEGDKESCEKFIAMSSNLVLETKH